MRMLQFVFAVIVAALYGVDLAHATKTRAPASSEWIFAEVVAALSALTCIVHCFVVVKRVAWSAWDAVLFVLWLAQTGVFGTLYVPREVEPADRATTTSLIRMRMAVWFDLLNMGLWLVSTVMGVAWCVRARRVTRSTEKCDCRESCVETGSERDVEEGIVPDSKAVLTDLGDGDFSSVDKDRQRSDALMQYANAIDHMLEAQTESLPPPSYHEAQKDHHGAHA